MQPVESAVTQQLSSFLSELQQSHWSHGSADISLDFSAADAAAQQQDRGPIIFRNAPLEVVNPQGYYYGNVAAVRFGNDIVIAVRKIKFYLSLRTAVKGYPLSPDPGESASTSSSSSSMCECCLQQQHAEWQLSEVFAVLLCCLLCALTVPHSLLSSSHCLLSLAVVFRQ
jgi:hypothetical protein